MTYEDKASYDSTPPCTHIRINQSFVLHAKVSCAVALVSSIEKIIGLFCKRALQKSHYSAKETYNFIDPLTVATPYVHVRFKGLFGV